MKKLAITLLFCLLSGVALAQGKWAPFQAQGPTGCGGYVCTGGNFVELPIGGGGFFTQLDIQCDQGFNACNNSGTTTIAISDDTYGGWIGVPGAWRQVNTRTSGITWLGRALDMVMAPSNTSRVYMMIDGTSTSTFLVSNDKGVTWTKPAGWSFTEGLAYYRNFSHYIAVDPFNQNIVYVGTFSNGVVYTLNGGTTFNTISTATVPQSQFSTAAVIAFDPSDVTGNTLYISSIGNAVYKCTSATTSPSCSVAQSTGQPLSAFTLRVDPKGGVWALNWDGAGCDNQCGSIYNLVSGTWSHLNGFSGNNTYVGLAVDTNNCSVEATCVVYVVEKNGGLNARLAGSWYGANNEINNRIATDVPWLAFTNENYMTAGGLAMDPSGSSKLVFTEGIGIWYSAPPPTTNATAINWTSITGGGLENLVTDTGISIPGHDPIFGFQDRAQFKITPGTYPSSHGCVNPTSTALGDGWWQDYETATPSTVVALCNNPPESSGISTNSGSTWTAFGSTSYFASGNNWGGCIATNDGTNILIIPGTAGGPFFSTNGGGSWSSVNIGSLGTTNWGGGFPNLGYTKRCAVDKTSGRFYAYNYDDPGNVDYLFSCTTSCQTAGNWTLLCTHCRTANGGPANTPFCPFFSASNELRPIPGHADWIMVAGCPDDGTATRGLVWLSTNGGVNFTQIPNTGLSVYDIGAACNGADFTAYFWGVVLSGPHSGHFGIWQGDFVSGTPTWTLIADTAGTPVQPNTNDNLNNLTADKNTCGTVYLGFAGSGVQYRTKN